MIIFLLCYQFVVETKGKDEEDLIELFGNINCCCNKPNYRKLKREMLFLRNRDDSE